MWKNHEYQTRRKNTNVDLNGFTILSTKLDILSINLDVFIDNQISIRGRTKLAYSLFYAVVVTAALHKFISFRILY